MPTATGKKARKAPSTATDSHRGHSQPPRCSRPPQLTTSGARAIIGTVWETTRYGISPRRTTPKRAITIGQRRRRPRCRCRKPTRARRNEYHAPASTTRQIGRSDVRLSGVERGARPSPTRGASPCRWPAGAGSSRATSPPSSGPTALYSSHAAATSTSARTNSPSLRITSWRDACSASCGDDVLAVGLQGGVLAVVLEVDGELVDAELAQLVQPAQLLVDRAEDAEAVDDLVGHELRCARCRPGRARCSRSPRGP